MILLSRDTVAGGAEAACTGRIRDLSTPLKGIYAVVPPPSVRQRAIAKPGIRHSLPAASVRQRTDGERAFIHKGAVRRQARRPPKQTSKGFAMDAATRTALIIAFAVAAVLLVFFGGGMATGTMMSGGMMGGGSMGGVSWMWLPILLVVVIGVALYMAIGKK